MDECYGPSWGLVHIGPDGRGTGGTGGIRDDPHDPKLLELEGTEKEEMQTRRLANPNAEAIKDIWRFQLDDEDTVGHDNQGRKWTRKGRQGVWFYVKPRPSLDRFLQTLSGLYELHVYTAGTRRYANAICTCIDPTGKYFSERILSRNESGSASVKSLKRLFPTDESMVVVIDDRWEVWAHGRNLVKVVPCESGRL
jgi:RNA polymerase II subunit A-like phosphatase